MGSSLKGIAGWLILFVLLLFAYNAVEQNSRNATTINFTEFLSEVENGKIAEVRISGEQIEGKRIDGSPFNTYSVEYPDLVGMLKSHNVSIDGKPKEESLFGMIVPIIIYLLPALIIVGMYVFFFRQMQSGGGKAMSFGKSRARMLTEKHGKVTFQDVAGIEEAKDELSEIVDFLRAPQKYNALGGKIPKGCLLVGPPGTGKTLLARAIAGEAGVPFFTISGSDFVEMFVGVGASRVRDMFEQGKKNAPCIIFIDEIDAVGRHRGAGLGGGNDEREQTLNQLLVEMDGFESREGVILIAATNRPDVLDPALLRPGRFDRQIVVPVPDIAGREKILEVHLKKVPVGPDVQALIIARGTPGFSGADLANLVNEAALLAARNNRKVVTMKELEAAKDKVMMGAERRSMVMSEEEKKLTAYHEAGHAIVSVHCPASDPIHKATIIPRGRALGLVMRLPERDRVSITREKLEADLAVAMGGRVAEEIIFGHEKVTSGASSDIKQATSMARAMVTQWGMSEKIGPLFHGSEQQEVFLGHSFVDQKTVSEQTASLIDSEIKLLVEQGYKHAKELLTTHKEQLHTLAKALLEYETLTGDEIRQLIDGKPLERRIGTPAPSKRSSLPKRTRTSRKKTEAGAESELEKGNNNPSSDHDAS